MGDWSWTNCQVAFRRKLMTNFFHNTYNLYTLCLKKVHPFCFRDYSVNCWPILIIFGNIAAEKICNQMTYSVFMIFTLFMNITK